VHVAAQEYLAIRMLSESERVIQLATVGDTESIAHNNVVMAKVCASMSLHALLTKPELGILRSLCRAAD
jgi:hypothetical protein